RTETMALKNDPTDTNIGVMIGADGRPKAIVDFELLFDLANKAGLSQRGKSLADPDIVSALSAEAEKGMDRLQFELFRILGEDEDTIDIAAAKAAENDESLPWEVAKKLIEGDNPIKVFRKYRGLTQRALADLVGTKPVYISQIETGASNPSAKLLRKLAKALNVTMDDLVD
ncbi:MAG: helix-turn-helix transcriptional regulator, partial [Alphaproteobacteria bacterium]|nr:helix-turn-helix transcriptional regulator [Alphaproteobacteria bacterium]